MNRLFFPVFMFALAGMSFVYGTWQYFYAREVLQALDARTASMIETIEHSPVARSQKQSLYTALFRSLPPGPKVFGIDVSGSFASQDDGDRCSNDGQRAVCRALDATDTELSVRNAVCGACQPKQ